MNHPQNLPIPEIRVIDIALTNIGRQGTENGGVQEKMHPFTDGIQILFLIIKSNASVFLTVKLPVPYLNDRTSDQQAIHVVGFRATRTPSFCAHGTSTDRLRLIRYSVQRAFCRFLLRDLPAQDSSPERHDEGVPRCLSVWPILMTTERVWRQYLQLLSRYGVTHVPVVSFPQPAAATRRLKESVPPASRKPSAPVNRGVGRPLKSPTELSPESVQIPAMLDKTSEIVAGPLTTVDEKSDALCRLAEVVAGCRRCTELAETRTQTVFGVGNPDARIMFIGEAPGADEDKQGEPFVGRAGKLLNKIIEACRIKREEIYICNILRCRPPGNRNPQPQEAANCREFLDAQIRVVNPDYIVCWGTVAAQNLLNEKRTIGKLRHVFHQYNDARVLCTYHPSYLLRNPSAKKDVWDDMKILMTDLGVELE